jgi:hypothetical protein
MLGAQRRRSRGTNTVNLTARASEAEGARAWGEGEEENVVAELRSKLKRARGSIRSALGHGLGSGERG